MRNCKLTPCVLVALLLVGVLHLEAAMATDFTYGEALDKSLMFFEAQRSGKLPSDQRVKWRGDSGLTDGLAQGVNLVGGYYDAGDHVKFGLPMAFTVTMLSWGAIEFRKEITDLAQMGQTLWAIRWGTDYFMKAHPQPNVLWGQVGDGDSDHYCWERPEDMTTPRTAYKIDENHPGSDLAGETAAALASAAIAFQPYNSSYSALLLKYVVDNAVYMGGTGWAVKEFSWDNKYAGVQILLSKVLLEGKGGAYTSTLKQYQAKADYFACACLQKNEGYNVYKTPGGLLYVREWNNLQYVTSASFLLAVYSEYLSAANAKLTCPEGQIQPQELLSFAKSQADYILGKNPKSMSYIVGFGSKYPVHVHHRGASIPDVSVLQSVVGCVQGFETWYHRPQANPNVIYGALVGGPDQNDNFSDDRSSYEETEPTLSGSGPLIGLFSKLQSLNGINVPGYNRGSSNSHHQTIPSPSPNQHEKQVPNKVSGTPIKFIHSISNTWSIGKMTYYRHKVILKNTSQKPVTDVKLMIENLQGPLWGLSPTPEKNTYELLQWQKVLQPASECTFVYIQGGPQAKISILSYH